MPQLLNESQLIIAYDVVEVDYNADAEREPVAGMEQLQGWQ